jgi:integrase/recombinase XerC
MEHERTVEGREPRGHRADGHEALKSFLASRLEERAGTQEGQRYYRVSLRPFVAAQGARPLNRWTLADTKAWIRTHPKWSPRTVQKFLTCLRTFTRWAREAGLDAPDLAGQIRGPRVQRRQREALTPDQVRALVETADGHPWLELPVALAAYAGLSWGDCRSLDWSEVDLVRKRIIRPRQKSGRHLNIPIAAPLAAVLARHRAVAGPVCRNLPKASSTICKAVAGLYSRAGVKRAAGEGLHFLRTAFVSAGVAAGVDLATMADLIGDNPAVVARYYTHSADGRRSDAATKIATAICGPTAPAPGAAAEGV